MYTTRTNTSFCLFVCLFCLLVLFCFVVVFNTRRVPCVEMSRKRFAVATIALVSASKQTHYFSRKYVRVTIVLHNPFLFTEVVPALVFVT